MTQDNPHNEMPKDTVEEAKEKLPPELDRFTVDSVTGCWNWKSPINTKGYGKAYYKKKNCSAHREVYKYIVGEIPEGLVIDHLCRNRKCVNPKHLEPVTNKENQMRGEGISAINARKTHCIRGHEFTEENTIIFAKTRRRCRKCARVFSDIYDLSKRPIPKRYGDMKKEEIIELLKSTL